MILANYKRHFKCDTTLGINENKQLDVHIKVCDEEGDEIPQCEGKHKTFGNSELTEGKWHFFTLVYNAETVMAYLDGQETVPIDGTDISNLDETFVVPENDSSSFNGHIAAFRIYGRALSLDEIIAQDEDISRLMPITNNNPAIAIKLLQKGLDIPKIAAISEEDFIINHGNIFANSDSEIIPYALARQFNDIDILLAGCSDFDLTTELNAECSLLEKEDEIKKMQRLRKITENDKQAIALWKAGFNSSLEIASMPEHQFIKQYIRAMAMCEYNLETESDGTYQKALKRNFETEEAAKTTYQKALVRKKQVLHQFMNTHDQSRAYYRTTRFNNSHTKSSSQ